MSDRDCKILSGALAAVLMAFVLAAAYLFADPICQWLGVPYLTGWPRTLVGTLLYLLVPLATWLVFRELLYHCRMRRERCHAVSAEGPRRE